MSPEIWLHGQRPWNLPNDVIKRWRQNCYGAAAAVLMCQHSLCNVVRKKCFLLQIRNSRIAESRRKNVSVSAASVRDCCDFAERWLPWLHVKLCASLNFIVEKESLSFSHAILRKLLAEQCQRTCSFYVCVSQCTYFSGFCVFFIVDKLTGHVASIQCQMSFVRLFKIFVLGNSRRFMSYNSGTPHSVWCFMIWRQWRNDVT